MLGTHAQYLLELDERGRRQTLAQADMVQSIDKTLAWHADVVIRNTEFNENPLIS